MGPGRCRWGRNRAHKRRKWTVAAMKIQPAASPSGEGDTWRRALKTKGISKQAENVSVEVSGRHKEDAGPELS
jgi:hypothetical protein